MISATLNRLDIFSRKRGACMICWDQKPTLSSCLLDKMEKVLTLTEILNAIRSRGKKEVNIDEEEKKKSEWDVIRQREAGNTDPTVIRDLTVNTFHRIFNNCLTHNFLSFLIIFFKNIYYQ